MEAIFLCTGATPIGSPLLSQKPFFRTLLVGVLPAIEMLRHFRQPGPPSVRSYSVFRSLGRST